MNMTEESSKMDKFVSMNHLLDVCLTTASVSAVSRCFHVHKYIKDDVNIINGRN